VIKEFEYDFPAARIANGVSSTKEAINSGRRHGKMV
jgi:hypothetical protein